MNRRDLLVAGSTSFLLGTGGCLDNSDENESQEESNDETEPQEESNDERWDYSGFEVTQFAVSSSAGWWSDGTDRTGYVELFRSEQSALDVLDFERVDKERREDVKSFVENTHYGGAAEHPGVGLLYIESVGPHTGYDEIGMVEHRHESTIAGTAKAKQTSEEGENETTFPSALVQSIGGSARYDITVIDGWGNEADIEGRAHDRLDPIELESIALLNEHQRGYEYNEDGRGYEYDGAIRRSGTGSTVTDSFELRGGLHALYFETKSASDFTIDLVPVGSDEDETRLADIETIAEEGVGWKHGGQFAFVPAPGAYQLDVRSEPEWKLTLIDLAAFRSNTGFEAISLGEGEEVHAQGVSDEVHVEGGGWNGVVGAVRLSPGMRIKLAQNQTFQNESDFPPAVTAYTESGQREVLFAETGEEGATVETALEGVTWFASRLVEGHSDDWRLHILPKS